MALFSTHAGGEKRLLIRIFHQKENKKGGIGHERETGMKGKRRKEAKRGDRKEGF